MIIMKNNNHTQNKKNNEKKDDNDEIIAPDKEDESVDNEEISGEDKEEISGDDKEDKSGEDKEDKSGEDNDDKYNLLRILQDFINDLLLTFPELKGNLDSRLLSIYKNENTEQDIKSIKSHCEKILPERFFDIIYQNKDIFENGEISLEFLPGIDFKILWNNNITDKTRETMWKYLQLLLFSTVSGLNDNSMFKDATKLFEAIDENALKSKLEDTIKHMEGLFNENSGDGGDDGEDGGSTDGEMDEDGGTGSFDSKNLPSAEDIHEHVTSMMDGKLGNLAKEIAEETAKDMNLDLEEGSVDGLFEKLFKNPTKIMGLVKKVGNKLDEKMKSGDLKESELLEEASNMMSKMKNMPGMGNMENLLGKMGMGGKGKMNTSAMQANLMRNLKLAKQKERMKKKQEDKSKNNKDVKEGFDLEEEMRKANEIAMELINMEKAEKKDKKVKKDKKAKKKRNKDK